MDGNQFNVGDDVFITKRDRWFRASGYAKAKVVRKTKTMVITSYRAYGRDHEVRFRRSDMKCVGAANDEIEPFEDKHNLILTKRANRIWWEGFTNKQQGDDMIAYLRRAVMDRQEGLR